MGKTSIKILIKMEIKSFGVTSKYVYVYNVIEFVIQDHQLLAFNRIVWR